jgi:Holliday junction resolvase RusA-like endonuclease
VIIVRSLPSPQGSKSARSSCYQDAQKCPRCKHDHLVRINLTEAVKGLKDWRKVVTLHARAAKAKAGLATITGPVLLAVTFTLARPKSHYRTGRYAHLLCDGAPDWPEDPPDVSKLARAIEDALTDAKVWKDDSQVVDYIRQAKLYPPYPLRGGPWPAVPAAADPFAVAGVEGADALDVPGVVIRVTRPRGWRGVPEPLIPSWP